MEHFANSDVSPKGLNTIWTLRSEFTAKKQTTRILLQVKTLHTFLISDTDRYRLRMPKVYKTALIVILLVHVAPCSYFRWRRPVRSKFEAVKHLFLSHQALPHWSAIKSVALYLKRNIFSQRTLRRKTRAAHFWLSAWITVCTTRNKAFLYLQKRQ